MNKLNNIIFKKIVNKTNKLILIKFWADWCGTCKIYNKIIDEIKFYFKNKIKLIKINNDFNYYLSELFAIKNLPTTILIKNKVILLKKQGFINKEHIKNLIKKYNE